MTVPRLSTFAPLLLALAVLGAASATEQAVTIKAISGMQYDTKRLAIAPGTVVKLTFVNDDATDMPHNFVLTRPGKRLDVVNAAAALGADALKLGFVPKIPEVIAAIPETKPHTTATLTFTVPSEPGIYPYVCTYPGHGFIMFGDLYAGVPMPAEPVAKAEDPGKPQHAYPLVRPYLYRLFMPDSGPASLAIMLPGDLNLCWDAGQCRPRYLWRGAGVDATGYWKGNGSGKVKLVGDKLWTAGPGVPLRLSPGKEPAVSFKGYALIQGYPELRYEIDGVAVKELVHEHENGKGLALSFQVDSDKPVFYVVDPAQSGQHASSVGAFKDGVLAVPAKLGRSFSVTVVPGTGVAP
jgi:azurin